MKINVVLLLIALSCSTLYGQAASTGMSFLKLGVGASSVGMGETGAASAFDASASYYNPAALSFLDQTEVSFMHRAWIADIATEYFGAAVKGDAVSLGFSFNATNTGSIDVRTQPGDPEGTFDAHDMAITGSLSVKIADTLSIGVSAKFLYEKIYVDEASGVAVDLGALYAPTRHLTIGLALSNIGSMSALRSAPIMLPFLLRTGASYAGALNDRFDYRVSGELVKIFRQSEAHVDLGGELLFDHTLALRAGYQTGYDVKNFSTGLGIVYGMMRFDYAFVPFESGFGTTHTFSLSFRI